jgi:hypothetical protein
VQKLTQTFAKVRKALPKTLVLFCSQLLMTSPESESNQKIPHSPLKNEIFSIARLPVPLYQNPSTSAQTNGSLLPHHTEPACFLLKLLVCKQQAYNIINVDRRVVGSK